MVVVCSECGAQFIKPLSVYGSPLIKCDYCKSLFYTPKVQEPALLPEIVVKKERLGFFVYSGAVWGAVMFLGVLPLYISTRNPVSLIICLFGLFMVMLFCSLAWSAYSEFKKSKQKISALLAESHSRLSNCDYQMSLMIASKCDIELFAMLKKYNQCHGYNYTEIIESNIKNQI